MTELEEIAGMPVVFLSGEPHEIGEAHGRLLGEQIRALRKELHRHIFGFRGRAFAVGFRWAALALARQMERHIPTSITMEMKAVASAAGVPYADILLLNCFDDLMNLLRVLHPRLGGLLCSSFALLPERTWHGHVLHGRNLDYYFPPEFLNDGGRLTQVLRSCQVLFAYAPQGGHAFLSLGWPGYVGTVTAMNERGLTLSSLTSYLPSNRPWGEPTGVLYRRVMHVATSLDDAERLLRAARRTIGNNLLVASGAEEDARLFQVTHSQVVAAGPEDGRLVCTNHFLDPSLWRRQRKTAPPHSLHRAERLGSICCAAEVDHRRAQGFLADTCRPYGCDDPFSAVANPGTLQSVIFSPAEERLWIATGEAAPVSQGGFEEVDAASLRRTGRRLARHGRR